MVSKRLMGLLAVLVTAWLVGMGGCADESDGPTPTLASEVDPSATCNFSNAENATGSQVIVLRSPDCSFSPMADDALGDTPSMALPRVFLVRDDGTEVEVLRVQFVSTCELHAVIDASLGLLAGTYRVRVVNPNGHASELTATLEVYDPPVIESIGPTVVCGIGQVVTITGSGFREGTTVTLNGEPVDATVVDDSTITFQMPEDAASGDTYEVVVISPEGCTATATEIIVVGDTIFTVQSIVPDRGWTGIDNPVTIYGEGFVPNMTVELVGAAPDGSNWPLTFVSIDASGTFIEAVVPQGGQPGGPYPVRVIAPDRCAVDLLPGFSIDATPSITITAIIPPFGWTQERTPVTIFGSGFISTPKAYLVIPDPNDDTVNPNRKLLSTAFVTSGTLNSKVPDGLPPGGPYDLVVINPDGGGGLLEDAFTVTAEPPPVIFEVRPGAGTTQNDTDVNILGCNFRQPLRVDLRASDDSLTAATNVGTPDCSGAADCAGGTQRCSLTATFPTTTLDVGAYVVRLTNEDEGSWGEWAAFVVTNPAVKLEVWQAGTNMTAGRRGLAAVAGRIDNANRFLYAIGGNPGSPSNALDTIEVVPLDIFGAMGSWFEQRYRLEAPRSDLTAIQQGGYIYALGGRSDASTALGTVERAKILLDDDAPVLEDPPQLAAGTLEPGTWYYVVSAMRPLSDVDNPGGETLPSDEVVVTLGVAGGIQLDWSAVSDATAYRIYRTESVDGTSSTEVFLAEVDAATLTYIDDGTTAVDPTRTPLRRGATGVWVTLPVSNDLASARYDHESIIAHDPSGDAFVYTVGGSSCGDCYELAPLSADGATLGPWQNGSQSLTEPRTSFALAVAEAANASQVPAPDAYVFATGGTSVSESLEVAQVQNGGQLSAWSVLGPPASGHPTSREMCEAIIINNAFYVVGGRTANTPLDSTQLANQFQVPPGPPELDSFSSSSSSMLVPREDFALVLESAFFYAIGGSSDGANAVSSVDMVIY